MSGSRSTAVRRRLFAVLLVVLLLPGSAGGSSPKWRPILEKDDAPQRYFGLVGQS